MHIRSRAASPKRVSDGVIQPPERGKRATRNLLPLNHQAGDASETNTERHGTERKGANRLSEVGWRCIRRGPGTGKSKTLILCGSGFELK